MKQQFGWRQLEHGDCHWQLNDLQATLHTQITGAQHYQTLTQHYTHRSLVHSTIKHSRAFWWINARAKCARVTLSMCRWIQAIPAAASLTKLDKKAQLSLTNPRDAKACQKLLQFDVLTTLSLTILAYLHSFSCCCVRNLQNPEKITENSNLWNSRSSKVIDLGVNGKPICDLLLVINSNFSRICYRFRYSRLKIKNCWFY